MNKLSILANVLRQNEIVETGTEEFDIQCEGVEEISRTYGEKEFNIFNENENDYGYALREENSCNSYDFQQSHLINTAKNGAGNKSHDMNSSLRDLGARNSREQTMKLKDNYEHENKHEKMASMVFERKIVENFYELDKEKEEQGRNKEIEQYNDKDSESIELKEDRNISKDWEIAETENGRYYLDF